MADVTPSFKLNPTTFLGGQPTLLKGFKDYTWSETSGSTGYLFWKKPVYVTKTPFDTTVSSTGDGAIYSYRPAAHTPYTGVDFSVDLAGGLAQITIARSGGTASNGVIYLPFKEDTTTFLPLDAGASWFFTGPLEGCHVYVATSPGGQPVVIHANANASSAATNARIKQDQANHVTGGLVGGYAITKTLTAADYKPANTDPYRAFVFGVNNGGWTFYMHSINLKTFAIINAHAW
jgi:hypothetical protein